MKRLTFSWGLLLIAIFSLQAQSARDLIYENIDRAGGGYLAYPVPENNTVTPPPSGYEPFYISHYGRHGSRYLISDKDYRWVHELFVLAEKHDALTPLGKSVKLRLDTVMNLCDGQGGALSSVGVAQQKGIAARMFRNYPQVFKGNTKISARSTVSVRCVLSMAAFCESLKEQNSKLDISRESAEKYLAYLNYHSEESNLYTSDNGPWREMYRKFERRHTSSDRMMKLLFSSEKFVENLVNPENLVWGLYWIAVDMQDIPTNISFYDLFTKDELYNMWQVPNLRYYIKDGSFAGNEGMVVDNAKRLLRNIIETADEAIASGETSATLRFGHDGNLIPLTALMRLDGCYESTGDPEKVKDIFCDFKISPMAANVQMIFFRNKKNPGDILVKFMLNEREIAIPVVTSTFPFYKWKDVKQFYIGRGLYD